MAWKHAGNLHATTYQSNGCSTILEVAKQNGPAPALTGVNPGLTTKKEWL